MWMISYSQDSPMCLSLPFGLFQHGIPEENFEPLHFSLWIEKYTDCDRSSKVLEYKSLVNAIAKLIMIQSSLHEFDLHSYVFAIYLIASST